jgi:CRISPR-associated Csx10 family RAMP protein
MDHVSGFYRRDPDSGEMAKAGDETRLQTHTGINRQTGTVQEGILYNRLVFVEHTHFWGMVKLPEHLTTPFHAFIEEVGLTGLVRVGTGRTRGMGKVHLSVKPLEDEQDRFEQFKKRLRRFNDKVHTQVRQAFPNNAGKLALQPFYFALTLHSPAILCDAMLRYHGSIDTRVLEELLNIPHDNFASVYQAASTRRVSGWNELWGLPRTNEYAIDTGSVFLFGSDIDPEKDKEKGSALWQALFTIEEEGIGRHKAEGYGRICVSDQFHEVELP